jgi:hypothetical protein
MEILILLGASNDEAGRLSPMAVARADTAIALCSKNSEARLIVTGGKDVHFNISPRPHVHWLARYLCSNGLEETRIVGAVLSKNTVEDAMGTNLLLATSAPEKIAVITSEFHSACAEFVFQCLFPRQFLRIVRTKNGLTDAELTQRASHEQRALSILRRQGGVVFAGVVFPHPALAMNS